MGNEFGQVHSSLDKGLNRSRDIGRIDGELGGLLSIFAKAPPWLREQMMRDFAKTREEFQSILDKEQYLQIVRSKAAMYGAMVECVDPKASLAQQRAALSERLGNIAGAMEALSALRKKDSHDH